MIYLCIPAHNEEQTVGVVLWKLRQVMAELQRDYQLLVVDDASTDRTPEVLEPYTRVLPLTVLRNEERRGYAACLEMLLREVVTRSDYPKRDVVIALQADFTDEPGHVATLIKRIESGADIVATNMLPPRDAPRLVRWRRPVLNGLLRRLKWPEEVRDPLNGFCAYRVLCIRRALEERKGDRLLRSDGWVANAELMRAAAPHARRVDSVELEPHAERLQRATRFDFMGTLRQVLALRRGKAPVSASSVESLRPARVFGGPGSQRSIVSESMDDGPTPATKERTREHPRGARNGTPRRTGNRERAGAERKPATGAARRERPPRKATKPQTAPDAVAMKANGAAPSAAAAADGAEETQRKRARRGRRGGRSRAPNQQAQAQDTSVTAELVEGVDAEGHEAAEQQNDGAPAAQQRRRARRGGRGRKRRTAADAQQTGSEAPEAISPPAPEPPSENAQTSQAS